jgi:hypothetical protein
MKPYDLIGQRFCRLVVKHRGKDEKNLVVWECLCDCGNTVYAHTGSLTSGKTKSCGCLRKDRTTKHHMSSSCEYRVWASMKDRCSNSKNKRYKDYGGRGIDVCQRWKDSFTNFLEDMGARPSPQHSIDRIDNNMGYIPDNCKWSTRSEQQRNKRLGFERNLPKGDEHWTRKNKELSRKIAIKNIKKAHKSGERNNNSKITYLSAESIRRLYENGTHMNISNFCKKTCGMFGVGRETIRKIIKGVAW